MSPTQSPDAYKHYAKYADPAHSSTFTDEQNAALPPTMKALVLHSRDKPLALDPAYPTPKAGPGSAIIRILSAALVSYSGDVFSGRRPYPFPTPLIPGSSAIARIEALGPDATSLHKGQLVWFDCTVRSRDNPSDDIMLHGFFQGATSGSAGLMHGEWRDSTYAQFSKVPLENLVPLDESRLLGPATQGGLGYDTARLTALMRLGVPWGGLCDVDLKVGETVIVAPASGPFGGAAVYCAAALGASRIVAWARNLTAVTELAKNFRKGLVVPCKLHNDPELDAAALAEALGQGASPGGAEKLADVYFDISPPEAQDSTHLGTAIRKLRTGGRVSLMGGIGGDVALPHSIIMRRSLSLKGTYMCTPEQARRLVALVESGALKLDEEEAGIKIVGRFGLEKAQEALDFAREKAGASEFTVLEPWL